MGTWRRRLRTTFVRSLQLTARPRALIRWLRSPRSAIRDVRAADALLAASETEPATVTAARIAELATRMAQLGHRRRSHALFDLAVRHGMASPSLLRGRRRSLGYVGEIDARHVADATAATGRPPTVRPTSMNALHGGRGGDVDVVVRHHFSDGSTMIRKTLRGAEPREVMTYRSGLLANGGRWWRAPRLHHLVEEPAGTWHLFLEDLGRVRPITSPAVLVRSARALGELNAAHDADAALIDRHPWLAPVARRSVAPGHYTDLADTLLHSIDGVVARRVIRTLEALSAESTRLDAMVRELELVWSHGDAHPDNIAERAGTMVLVDWTACRIAPIGGDLGILLRVPNRTVASNPWLVPACIDAYAEAMGVVRGTRPPAASVELGYRFRFVARSFRWQLARLPSARPEGGGRAMRHAASDVLTGRRQVAVEANFDRLCAEAEQLLLLVGR